MVVQNDLLVLVTQQLALKQPNWQEVVERFRRSSMYRRNKYDETLLASYLSEIHIRHSLEEICKDFNGRIEFNTIANWSHTKDFVFIYFVNGLRVFRFDGREHSQIDDLVIIEDLPVLFEVKLGRYGDIGKYSSPNSKRKQLGLEFNKPGNRGVRHAMDENRIKYLLKPLKQYFDVEDCGYVLITDPNYIKPHLSPVQAEFLKKGGILVPFYTDRRIYRQDVARIRQENGI